MKFFNNLKESFKFKKFKNLKLYILIFFGLALLFALSFDFIKTAINNCYAYAFGDMSLVTFKRQPGDRANKFFNNKFSDLTKKDYTCEELTTRVLQDYPYPESYVLNDNKNDTQCKENYYKVMLAIDNVGEKQDYHFYKQLKDHYGNYSNLSTWQHKPGTTMVRNYDDSGNLIKDPNTADRNYDNNNNETDYNYATLCNSFCVKEP